MTAQAIPQEILDKYNELKTKLKSWSRSYYIDNDSQVEDAVYDANLQELIKD